MDHDKPVDEAVRGYLSTGRKYYASDAEISEAAGGIPFYLNGRPGQKALVALASPRRGVALGLI